MISSKNFKIKRPEVFTSEYIENEFKRLNLDVIRYAVTGYDEDCLFISVSYVIPE